MLQYCCFEINEFELLQSKLEDLQRNDWSVDVTPIFNSQGKITTYFVFAKKLKTKESKVLPIKDINPDIKLNTFFK